MKISDFLLVRPIWILFNSNIFQIRVSRLLEFLRLYELARDNKKNMKKNPESFFIFSASIEDDSTFFIPLVELDRYALTHLGVFHTWKAIYYVHCISIEVRGLFMGYLLSIGSSIDTCREWDIMFAAAAMRFEILDRWVFATGGMLALFSCYTDYSLYYCLDRYLINLTHDMMVKNLDGFTQLNRQFALPKDINVLSICSWFQMAKVAYRIWNVDAKTASALRFRYITLPHMRFYPPLVRARAIVITITLESCVAISNLAVCKFSFFRCN